MTKTRVRWLLMICVALEMAELGLQLEEEIALLDDYNQQSRRTRLQNNRSGRS
ncbi:MAG: hypothetical protein GDA43_10780 [Hormoscilla sp. SP5CHS1]|nr:hypothetical protein [Hormoscilla sp. SP12CHS1]MBC6453633.1 hypothetical protein [Hormoscilla sp. SP5CHS1]